MLLCKSYAPFEHDKENVVTCDAQHCIHHVYILETKNRDYQTNLVINSVKKPLVVGDKKYIHQTNLVINSVKKPLRNCEGMLLLKRGSFTGMHTKKFDSILVEHGRNSGSKQLGS